MSEETKFKNVFEDVLTDLANILKNHAGKFMTTFPTDDEEIFFYNAAKDLTMLVTFPIICIDAKSPQTIGRAASMIKYLADTEKLMEKCEQNMSPEDVLNFTMMKIKYKEKLGL